MKKIILAAATLLFLAGCSTQETSTKESTKHETTESTTAPLNLSIKTTEVETDVEGVAVIEGTTTSGARVTVGMGIIGDSVEADADGHFKLTHSLVGDGPETITINANSKGSITESMEVVVKLSQAATDQRVKDADIRNLADEATDSQRETLKNLMTQKFKQDYPYKGSKVHSALGVIQDWTQLNDSWFYKAEATIVNEFGAEREVNLEVLITPTDANSGTVEIITY